MLLAVDMMSADAVSDGRLVRPFECRPRATSQYWLAVQEGKRETKKMRLFREWLRKRRRIRGGYVEQLQRQGEEMSAPET